jgi:hypothetical protein
MPMNTKNGLTAVIILAVLIGCIPNLKDVPREKCVAMPADNVMTALHDNCIRCHTKDFTTKQDVCGLRGRIIEQVRTKKMPKIGKLWPSYYETLVQWK